MSVYNGGSQVAAAIQCILDQRNVELELIVIDDGATDQTPRILHEFSERDPRVRILRQANTGLTRALQKGCQAARGTLIARHDLGDNSLFDRLAVQKAYLQQHPDVVATGCGVHWIGPNGEDLGEWVRCQTPAETTCDLLKNGIGFVHPSVMFRRDAYLKSGGYRSQFRFAQDHDLWYRMAEQGLLATCPEVLFEYRMDVAGISPQNRTRQLRLGQLARECFLARQRGESEAALLEEANRVSWETSTEPSISQKQGQGAAAYFVGSQLYQQRDQRCRRYLKMALAARARPLQSAIKYATSFLNCRDKENNR